MVASLYLITQRAYPAMAITYINPTTYMQSRKILIFGLCSLFAIASLWFISTYYAAIMIWASMHLSSTSIHVLMTCLPLILSAVLFQFGMNSVKFTLRTNNSQYVHKLVSDLITRLNLTRDDFKQVLDDSEIEQLLTVLRSDRTQQHITEMLRHGYQGILLKRKAVSKSHNLEQHEGSDESTAPSYMNNVWPMLPRKILLRYESASGEAVNSTTNPTSDAQLSLYIYPKSKLAGGSKDCHEISHPYKTKSGIERVCEPVIGIHPQSTAITEMVVISDRKKTSDHILSVEPNYGMSLKELLQFKRHDGRSNLSDHRLRKRWVHNRFSVDQALKVVADVAKIIGDYHTTSNTTHYDIASKNITISPQGHVSVIDWPDVTDSRIHCTPAVSIFSEQNTCIWDLSKKFDPALQKQLDQYTRFRGSESLMAHPWFNPNDRQSFYHDSWAILTLAVECFYHTDNDIFTARAQYAAIMTAIDMLKTFGSQFNYAIHNEKTFDDLRYPAGFRQMISPVPRVDMRNAINAYWPANAVITRLKHYYDHTAQDFLTNQSSFPILEYVPLFASDSSTNRITMHDSEAARLQEVNRIFNHYASSLALFHTRYNLCHLFISCDTLKQTPQDTPCIDWDVLIQQREAGVCRFDGRSNITPGHLFFETLCEKRSISVRFGHNYKKIIYLLPQQHKELSGLLPKPSRDIEDIHHPIHDTWSLLYAYFGAVSAYKLVFNKETLEFVSTDSDKLLLSKIASSEIIERMRSILLTKSRDSHYPDNCEQVFKDLTNRISIQFEYLTRPEVKRNDSVNMTMRQALSYLLTDGKGYTTLKPEQKMPQLLLDQLMQHFIALSHVNRGMCKLTAAGSLCAMLDQFIDIGEDDVLIMNWLTWFDYRATPDLEQVVNIDIIAGLRMCMELSGPSENNRLVFFESRQRNLKIIAAARLVGRTFLMRNTQYDYVLASLSDEPTLLSLRSVLSDTSMVYTDTWLMLHTLIRSFVLLPDQPGAVDKHFIEPVLYTLLELIAIVHPGNTDARPPQARQEGWDAASVMTRLSEQILASARSDSEYSARLLSDRSLSSSAVVDDDALRTDAYRSASSTHAPSNRISDDGDYGSGQMFKTASTLMESGSDEDDSDDATQHHDESVENGGQSAAQYFKSPFH